MISKKFNFSRNADIFEDMGKKRLLQEDPIFGKFDIFGYIYKKNRYTTEKALSDLKRT